MSDQIRTGVKKGSRERKNGAAAEAWTKRKAAINASRGCQNVLEVVDEKAIRIVRSR